MIWFLAIVSFYLAVMVFYLRVAVYQRDVELIAALAERDWLRRREEKLCELVVALEDAARAKAARTTESWN